MNISDQIGNILSGKSDHEVVEIPVIDQTENIDNILHSLSHQELTAILSGTSDHEVVRLIYSLPESIQKIVRFTICQILAGKVSR